MIKVHNIEHMTYDGVAAVAASRQKPQGLTTAVGIVIMADSDTSCTERSPASSSRMSPKRGRGAGPSKGQSKGRGRGRGRGRPRSRAKSSGQDTDLTDVNKKAQTAGSDTETSESPETLRIAEAEKAWQATMKRPRPSCKAAKDADSDSDTELSGVHNVAHSTGSLAGFISWICETVMTDAEKTCLMRFEHGPKNVITMGEFCAGMCSGTIAMHFLEKVFNQLFGKCPTNSTELVTEMVPWKRQVCQMVCDKCGCKPVLVERTADACQRTDVHHVQLAVAAMECDDISAMSSTPKSVVDETGKSGRSLLEFMEWLDSLEFSTRPQILVMECVAALMKERSVVSEKGTAVVSKLLVERGFVGSWRMVNTKHFSVPQSRGRTYGVFCRLMTFGDAGETKAKARVTSMWEFVDRCKTKTSGSEALHDLLTRALTPAGVPSKKPRSDRKKEAKWRKDHVEYRKQHNLVTNDALCPISQEILGQVNLLTEREREVAALTLHVALKKNPNGKWFAGNIGDSVRYCRFSSTLHPCLLPQKKYLYANVTDMTVFLNSANLYFALQGLSADEVQAMGLDEISLTHAKDLCGNAFSLPVIVAIVLAALLNVGMTPERNV